MSTTPLTFSRPAKLDHIDTIQYEISMLRFAAMRLAEQKLTERDAWVYLESFLLHFRNLIEFLGKDRPTATDLHVTTIWALTSLTPPARLNGIYADGKLLLAKYEPSDAAGGGRISQYLQHVTTKRIDAKEWEVSTMMNEINPLLIEIEQSFPTKSPLIPAIPPGPQLDHFTASTTIATHTSAATVVPKPSEDFK